MEIHTPSAPGIQDRTRSTGTASSVRSGGTLFPRRPSVVLVLAASAPPILYMAFLWRYATNSLQFDDWTEVPFLAAAVHGHLSLGHLWSQHGEARVPLVRLDLLFFARFDHLDTRATILADAVLLIAAYVLILGLFSRYAGRLTPFPVLMIGILWFSFGDVQNALWAFQVGWSWVLFGFIAMLFSLLVPRGHRRIWFAMAIAAAVISSLGFIQGFVVWPLGAVAIYWCRPRGQGRSRELLVWALSFTITAAFYFIGYSTALSSCSPIFGCTKTSALAHPVTALGFYLALLGNVVPGRFLPNVSANVTRFEVLGTALLIAAVFVIVRSCRRRTRERLPLPLLLVSFGLLFNAAVTWGRLGEGVSGAIHNNRYVMANLVLVSGLVMYAWRHLRELRSVLSQRLVMLLVVAFVLVQMVVATNVGISSASYIQTGLTNQARVVVNFDRIPPSQRACELGRYLVTASSSEIVTARRASFSEFAPGEYRRFRRLGPPNGFATCNVR